MTGKVAIITGAANGIGRAMVIAFAAEGAHVVAADIDESGVNETARVAGREQVFAVRADVTHEPDVEKLVSTAIQRHGKLTTLCNNAGILIPGDVVTAAIEDFERTMAVNVRGVFLGCKYAIPRMIEGGGGSIINTGSGNSLVADPMCAAYCTSKGAVLMLTKAVAIDFVQQGIRCNCLCPGFINTQMNEPYIESMGGWQQVVSALPPWQPIGEPEDIARVAVFLASDDSKFMTGSAVVVDGGFTAH